MKIIIKAEGYNIRLWFPLSVLKSRIGYTVVKNAIEHNINKYIAKYKPTLDQQTLQVEVVADTQEQAEQIKQDIAKDITITRKQMVRIYNVIRQYVEINGHFNLVEVESANGEKVLVRV